jgi:hypothetical protein
VLAPPVPGAPPVLPVLPPVLPVLPPVSLPPEPPSSSLPPVLLPPDRGGAAAGRTEEDRHQSEPEVLLHGRTLTSAFRAARHRKSSLARRNSVARGALHFFRSLVVRSGHF